MTKRKKHYEHVAIDRRYVAEKHRLLKTLSDEFLFVTPIDQQKYLHQLFKMINKIRKNRDEPPYEIRDFFVEEDTGVLICEKCHHKQVHGA